MLENVNRNGDYRINQASLVLGNLVERKHFSKEGSGQQYHVSERATGYGDMEAIGGIDVNGFRVVKEDILADFLYLLVIHIKPLCGH